MERRASGHPYRRRKFSTYLLSPSICISNLYLQGTGDNFYKQGQLLPENFEAAARDAGIKGLNIRYQPDYDHSYYTMSSFADDHVEHAAKYLFA